MEVRTIAAIAATALAVVVFATTLARATLYSPQGDLSPSTPVTAASPDTPTRLRIPALGVNAAVQAVGVAKSGNMAVPTNYTDVGWYRGGPKPGQAGSAVMDGHVDNGLGAPAVFKDVQKLKRGDQLFVDTASGTLRFVVDDIAVYPRDEVPLEKVFEKGGAARLNLITCEGEWLADEKTYDQRVVVYTRLAP